MARSSAALLNDFDDVLPPPPIDIPALVARLDLEPANENVDIGAAETAVVALLLRSVALANAGQLNEALSGFIEASEKTTDTDNRYVAYCNCGIVLLHLGMNDEAALLYTSAILTKHDSLRAHLGRGIALHLTGKTDEAVESFARATEIDPENVDAQYGLGFCLNELGEYARAILPLSKALELEPTALEIRIAVAFALTALGRQFTQEKKYDEAERFLRNAIRADEEYGRAHYSLGVVFSETDRPEEAVTAFERAINLKPDSAVANLHYGASLLFHRRQPDRAMPFLRYAEQHLPDPCQAHYCLGRALILLGNLDEAITQLKDAIRTGYRGDETKGDDTYFFLGYALETTHQFVEAIEAFSHFIEQNPIHADAYYHRANSLLELAKQDRDPKKITSAIRAYSYVLRVGHPQAYRENVSAKVYDAGVLLEEILVEREKSQRPDADPIATYQAAATEVTPAAGRQTREQIREARDRARLGILRLEYQARLETLELPPGGYTTKPQADAAARLATTLRELQKLERKLGVSRTETPERVKSAEAMASAYRRRHDLETGEPLPPRPRGRPRRSAPPGRSP